MTNRFIHLSSELLLSALILIPVLGILYGCGNVGASNSAAISQEATPVDVSANASVSQVKTETDIASRDPVPVTSKSSSAPEMQVQAPPTSVKQLADSMSENSSDKKGRGDESLVGSAHSAGEAYGQKLGEETVGAKTGVNSDVEQTVTLASSGEIHYGSSFLEERINLADIIARVAFVSVSAAVAHIETEEGTLYSPGVSYRFNVLEYLKGNEGDQIEAIAYAYSYYDSETPALEAADAILPEVYDKRWELVQSIIFLHEDTVDGNGLLSSHQHQFVIAGTGVSPVSNFHIDNEYNKVWLPAAWGDTPESDIGDGIEFLLDDPDNYDDKLEIPTITLENLREFVEDLQEEHDAGVNEHGKKVYKACLVKKYDDLRFDEHREYRRYDIEGVPSGTPAGTQILTEENWGRTPQKTLHLVDHIEGNDAELFSVDPFYFHTVRPIPRGTYRFYRWGYGEAPDDRVRHACGADILSERARTSIEFFIQVVAPDDTIHEAFFDPVSLESGVGATASEGIIVPSVLANGGREEIKIDRVSWNDSKVEIVLSDEAELDGHHIDFIALDGSTLLRLDFDEASQTEVSDDAKSLNWGVCEQPWKDGDQLMIRISKSGADLSGATNDTKCE